MEYGEDFNSVDNISVNPSTSADSAVNNLILDYYKKFGRKRDLEQFFSLSTAQSEIRDPSGTFWRRMKSQNDSSDSGEKKSDSSTELCRISIKCSVPEPPISQHRSFEEHQNSDSESPPIITEEVPARTSRNSDEESLKSDDGQSQQSHDATLDTSMNKPHSPTSSITSQRKLEWDSLADVGYANESDRKTSASSLSTLERLALKQQYSHNDTKQNIELGPPTSHSTPVEVFETKSKGKKGFLKKTTKIYQKDVDLVELNLPHNSQTNLPQAVSVNLSKHISFNVEKDGEINIDNIKKNVSVSPETKVETSKQIQEKIDKEIQTSLLHNMDKNNRSANMPLNNSLNMQKFPVLISLNTLRKKHRKRKLIKAKKNLRHRIKLKVNNEDDFKEKVTEQVSEAESFEYMPGHIYNQNHWKINQNRGIHVDNKSSLESSAGLTTLSSKGSKKSFSKDFEKSIDLLKTVLQQHNNDSTLKKRLIKEVVQRLIKSKYRDDESSTDFLSGLSFNSKVIGGVNQTTTSTSDDNNTGNKSKLARPKKSILQTAKFNSNAIASTSQSAPNLPSVSYSEKPVVSNLTKSILISNTDSEMSSKEKHLSDIGIVKKSDEFYKKYLEALRKEESYKKHLKDKENFLQHKLVSSETALTQLGQTDLKTQSKLKSLLRDLTRNNYNDGSGDASKLEGHSNSNIYMDPYILSNNQRSHSVFTLSSGRSDGQNRNPKVKNIIKSAINKSSTATCSKNEQHYCCCPHHIDHARVGFTDSSVQVNIKCDSPVEKPNVGTECHKSIKCAKCKKESLKNITKVVSDSETGDLKYICVCSDELKSDKVPENFHIYKCSRLVNKSIQLGDSLTRSSNAEFPQGKKEIYTCCCEQRNIKPNLVMKQNVSSANIPQVSKSSQTNVNVNLMMQRKSSVNSFSSQVSDSSDKVNVEGLENCCPKLYIQEAIRSIQTDISINPKLSDPCLSDINILNDKECVILIKEQYKKISKSNSENNTDALISEKKSQTSIGNSSVKLTSKSSAENIESEKQSIDYAFIAQLDKEVQSDLDLMENNRHENYTDQFTIPIQGTNMTLKVNLGTKEPSIFKLNNTAIKSQGVATENPVAEQFTSLREDCTKSVQCCDANIFHRYKQDNIEQNLPDKNIGKNKVLTPRANACIVSTCLPDKSKSSTYPKKDQVHPRKPLLRTNTDIDKFENLSPVQLGLKGCEKTKNKLELSSDSRTISTNKTKSSNCENKIIDDSLPNTNNQSEKCAICSNDTGLINPIKPNYQSQANKCYNCSKQETLSDQPTNQDDKNHLEESCTPCLNRKDLTDPPPKIIIENKSEQCADHDQNQTKNLPTFSNPKDLNDQVIKSSNLQNLPNTCTACFNQKVLTDKQNKPQSPPEKNIDNFKQIESPDQVTQVNNESKDCTTCSGQKYVNNKPIKSNNQSLANKCTSCFDQKGLFNTPTKMNNQNKSDIYLSCSSKCSKLDDVSKGKDALKSSTKSITPSSESESHPQSDSNRDPILDIIEDITKRYTKKNIEKNKRKKCFKEIMNVLNYLLDTEDGTDDQNKKSSINNSSSSSLNQGEVPEKAGTETECCPSKTFVDKGVQLSTKKCKSTKSRNSESSEIVVTSECPMTSSDSTTCKVLNRIKKECERYHQKRCKSHGLNACETSSTTSVNCGVCKRVHHCHCVRYKCKTYKSKTCADKPRKKCVAYNLILQTSDSVVSEDMPPINNRPLKSIIVKVPSKKTQAPNVPFKEMAAKLERNVPSCSPRSPCKSHRSRSWPNESEISSNEEFQKKPQIYTVREYLEKNRPDFVEKSSQRQDCLKIINETRPEMGPSPFFKMVVVHTPKCVAGTCLDPCNIYCGGGVPHNSNQCVDPYIQMQNGVTRIASERHAKRKLLSLQLSRRQTLSALTDDELRHFAKQLSEELRRKKVAPKFISEREMKKHSEKIYKSLPEVTRKKEEVKKENIKKTNLLMANIFKKNLQKKTLGGSVNLSNYSTVIKI